MPKFKYVGSSETAVNYKGIIFEPGQPVEVEDPVMVAKLSDHTLFAEDGAAKPKKRKKKAEPVEEADNGED